MTTYREILSSFKDLLEKCLVLTCISDKISHTSVGDDGQVTTTYSDNSAKMLLDDWINEMDVISETIYNSLNSLFVDPDDEYNTPESNYQIINGYADGSRSLECYDKESEEFSEMADYWYVRGNLYDMLSKANEGLYVYKFLQNIKNVVSLCNEYELKYEDYPEPSPSVGEDGTEIPVSKVEVFWDEYFTEFEESVNSELKLLLSEKNKFYELIQFTRDYRKVYEDVSIWLSKAESFVSALQKTSTGAGKSLSDSFANIGVNGFELYSTNLSLLYNLFIAAKEERDASHYAQEDDSNLYLRKIFNSEILLNFNFFERAKDCLTWILEFRNHYNI